MTTDPTREALAAMTYEEWLSYHRAQPGSWLVTAAPEVVLGLVIATSKDSARKIAGVGRTNFDNYWVQQPEADQALEPGVLYTRAFTYSEPAPWYRGRCPLPSREPS
jgi:hypothetical protein